MDTAVTIPLQPAPFYSIMIVCWSLTVLLDKGTLSFAGSGKDSRTCHIFIADEPKGKSLGKVGCFLCGHAHCSPKLVVTLRTEPNSVHIHPHPPPMSAAAPPFFACAVPWLWRCILLFRVAPGADHAPCGRWGRDWCHQAHHERPFGQIIENVGIIDKFNEHPHEECRRYSSSLQGRLVAEGNVAALEYPELKRIRRCFLLKGGDLQDEL